MKVEKVSKTVLHLTDAHGRQMGIEGSEMVIEAWKLIHSYKMLYGDEQVVRHVKMVRSITGIGLKEAKYLVEDAYHNNLTDVFDLYGS